MDENLANLRNGIDDCDKQLVELLAKRSALTKQVGQIKKRNGAPLYVPSREAELVAARRSQASEMNVNPDLVEDLLRRMMREAYQNQQTEIACVAPELSPVTIVGGSGAMGQLFAKQLMRSGYEVNILDKDNLDEAEQLLASSKCVIIAVPINAFSAVLNSLPNLPKNCLLLDITSIKAEPLKAMKAYHSGPVLGLHPMFGPDIPHWVKQTVVACEDELTEQARAFIKQLEVWGCRISYMAANRHDELMQIVQVMRHLTTFVYGQFLAQQSFSLAEIEACSSPIYHLELMMVGRLFAQSPELYSDIMLAQFDAVEGRLDTYKQVLEETISKLKENDKAALISAFSQSKQFFSDEAEHFLEQSKSLLSKANDARAI